MQASVPSAVSDIHWEVLVCAPVGKGAPVQEIVYGCAWVCVHICMRAHTHSSSECLGPCCTGTACLESSPKSHMLPPAQDAARPRTVRASLVGGGSLSRVPPALHPLRGSASLSSLAHSHPRASRSQEEGRAMFAKGLGAGAMPGSQCRVILTACCPPPAPCHNQVCNFASQATALLLNKPRFRNL